MPVAIYYFSGTGNSLAVARAVAARLGCTAVAIQEVMNAPTIAIQADTVGVVFPTYLLASLRAAAQEPADSNLGFRALMSLTDRSISVDDIGSIDARCALPATNGVRAMRFIIGAGLTASSIIIPRSRPKICIDPWSRRPRCAAGDLLVLHLRRRAQHVPPVFHLRVRQGHADLASGRSAGCPPPHGVPQRHLTYVTLCDILATW
jgi:hypothetical protein